MKIKVGQIVGRISYQSDVLFRVIEIYEDKRALLYGEDFRLVADAPLDDLIVISEREKSLKKKKVREKEESCYYLFRQDKKLMKERNNIEAIDSYFEIRGRVLHIDGDPYFLRKCMDLYDRLGVPVYGVHISEKEIPSQVSSLLEMVQPDILVITGHDSLKVRGQNDDLKAYRHSKQFAEAVRIARRTYPRFDDLVIFAGACQSHFETLIKAGANFASSPERINIHALDPVYIAAKVSLTSFTDKINLWDILRSTITGEKGIGGIETKGFMRKGMPLNDQTIIWEKKR